MGEGRGVTEDKGEEATAVNGTDEVGRLSGLLEGVESLDGGSSIGDETVSSSVGTRVKTAVGVLAGVEIARPSLGITKVEASVRGSLDGKGIVLSLSGEGLLVFTVGNEGEEGQADIGEDGGLGLEGAEELKGAKGTSSALDVTRSAWGVGVEAGVSIVAAVEEVASGGRGLLAEVSEGKKGVPGRGMR